MRFWLIIFLVIIGAVILVAALKAALGPDDKQHKRGDGGTGVGIDSSSRSNRDGDNDGDAGGGDGGGGD